MRALQFISFCWLAITAAGAERPLILVHYMPWYETKAFSGQWGWHWTMNKFQPDKVVNGRRELASHYRPLIGAYDSNDPHALECHALLMKFAGIDGAILDWYGIRKHNDYAMIHRNSLHFVKHLKRAGLKFAACYEDQSVKHMISGKALPAAQAVPHGREVMRWLQTNWFRDPAYVKTGGRPLLLVFGPQHFNAGQWPQLTAGLQPPPTTFVLPHLTKQLPSSNAFGWPPVHGGNRCTPAIWGKYLDDLDRRAAQGEAIIAAVFPKFHDIYKEAGLHDSYGYLDDQNGKTFEQTLDRALHGKSRIIQIATWNDYGEGTIIEPTKEFAYRYLESLQRRRAKVDPTFRHTPWDLRLPVMLYLLRKRDATLAPRLNAIAQLLHANRTAEAKTQLTALWEQK